MKVEEVLNVTQVVIKTTKKDLIINKPKVSLTHVHGQHVYQVAGGKVTEREANEVIEEKQVSIPEEDVLLVAQQAKASLEKARKALEESNGDLAKAILKLINI